MSTLTKGSIKIKLTPRTLDIYLFKHGANPKLQKQEEVLSTYLSCINILQTDKCTQQYISAIYTRVVPLNRRLYSFLIN